MSRLKAKYVAQVTIEIDEEYRPDVMLPIDKIRDILANSMTPELETLLFREIDCTRVKVDQQYADTILEEEDGH